MGTKKEILIMEDAETTPTPDSTGRANLQSVVKVVEQQILRPVSRHLKARQILQDLAEQESCLLKNALLTWVHENDLHDSVNLRQNLAQLDKFEQQGGFCAHDGQEISLKAEKAPFPPEQMILHSSFKLSAEDQFEIY